MERIKSLIARYKQTAFLFFIGLVLIAYLAHGVLYFQQEPQQRELEDQVVRLTAILRNPLPSREELETENERIAQALAPLADNVTIAMLLDLARSSGIDIKEESGRFQVPIATHSRGPGSYQLTSFKNIHVQGDYDKVLAFIKLLDSDEPLIPPGSLTPRTVVRVVTRVAVEELEVTLTGQEAGGNSEFRSIIAAVKEMMVDNSLFRIPNPLSFNLGKAYAIMGDDPNTPSIFEGFPDVTTTPTGKGYTGNATPKKGYLLYGHDKISTDNRTLYTTKNYFPSLRATYYYTVEADGTVYRWNNEDEPSSYSTIEDIPKWNKDSSPTRMELKANLDISFYFKS